MSRFGEPKPVERIKVLPQKTIKKVASKQKVNPYKACIYGLCRDSLDGVGYDLGTIIFRIILRNLFGF